MKVGVTLQELAVSRFVPSRRVKGSGSYSVSRKVKNERRENVRLRSSTALREWPELEGLR